MRYSKLTGIIVNRFAVRDTDRFFTIFTRDQGKISVFARSVRSSRSRRMASLDLFNLINFEVSQRGFSRTLTHVELVDSFRSGKKKMSDISRLFVLGELIDTLLPEDDPHPEVYELLFTALANLSRFETPEYLNRFKLKLLKLLGYGTPPGDIDTYIESILDKSLKARHIL